jgi:hypothetical protein
LCKRDVATLIAPNFEGRIASCGESFRQEHLVVLRIVVNESRKYWLVRPMQDHFDEIYVLTSGPAATYAGARGEKTRVDFYWVRTSRRSNCRNHGTYKKSTRP